MFSHLSLGKIGFFVTLSVKLKWQIKLSSLKCVEHIHEFRVGSDFVLFFGCFFASGCSSLKKGVACKIKPIFEARTPSRRGVKSPTDRQILIIVLLGFRFQGDFFKQIYGSCSCSRWWFQPFLGPGFQIFLVIKFGSWISKTVVNAIFFNSPHVMHWEIVITHAPRPDMTCCLQDMLVLAVAFANI